MRKSLLLCASLLVSGVAMAGDGVNAPVLTTELKQTQIQIKQAYDSALKRVTDPSALAKSQDIWYKKSEKQCLDYVISHSKTDFDGIINDEKCHTKLNYARIKYLNKL